VKAQISLITACLAFAMSAYAGAPAKKRVLASVTAGSAQDKLVVEYFNCFAIADKAKVKKCLENILDSELSSSNRDRFYAWVPMFEPQLSRLGRCTDDQMKEAGFFPEATEDFTCGQVLIDGLKKDIIFFFKLNKSDQPKLYSIYY
jgi:hypothetical protein